MKRADAITTIGLKQYLNEPYSVVKHNGHTYDDFVKYVDVPAPMKVNKRRLAQLFNVSAVTVAKWVAVWEEENE